MTKAAILIDGGFFLKRLPTISPQTDMSDPRAVASKLRYLVRSHLKKLNETAKVENWNQLRYRCFYYDAKPNDHKDRLPISNVTIDFAKTDVARMRTELFSLIRAERGFALRLGEVRPHPNRLWQIKTNVVGDLRAGKRDINSLTDDDFKPTFMQKAVDMRIGLDIASITFKRQADTIILVTGDSDFVPAAKLARREGMEFILDALHFDRLRPDLHEHIDGLVSAFPKPKPKPKPKSKPVAKTAAKKTASIKQGNGGTKC